MSRNALEGGQDISQLPSGIAANDYSASMGPDRNWICCVIFRRACGRRMVHELGSRARICAVCGLPDCARSRIVDAVDAWNDVIS